MQAAVRFRFSSCSSRPVGLLAEIYFISRFDQYDPLETSEKWVCFYVRRILLFTTYGV